MFQYTIKLPFRIDSCLNCPFRREDIINEDIQSNNVMSGIVNITRRQSSCPLKQEILMYSETVNGYNNRCPLSGNVMEIPDRQEGDSKCQR